MTRLAKSTECPKCHSRYALKTIYGGAMMLPIGKICIVCGYDSTKVTK